MAFGDSLVSIIMPTYNRGGLIEESIQSVRNQTYRNWELIITDDGSTDNTPEVVAKIPDSRIHYHSFSHSGGFGTARNRGLKLSKGDVIAFLDSDDLWREDKLAFQLSLLNQYPQSHFVLSNIDLFGATEVRTPDFKSVFSANLFLPLIEERDTVFYPSSLLFKKEVLQKTGLMNEKSPTGADLEFLFSMSLSYKGNFTNERLTRIRKHAHNTSGSDKVFGYPDSIAHATKFHREGFLSKNQYKQLLGKYYYRMGMVLVKNSQPGRAIGCFAKHCVNAPKNVKGWIRLAQSILLNMKNSIFGI
jgi:glycosyltransferase involved in cell wall biosynthesis